MIKNVVAGEVNVALSLAGNPRYEEFGPRHEKDHPRRLLDGLSDRERQILDLVTSGLSDREIGAKLYLGENTVKQYMIKVMY